MVQCLSGKCIGLVGKQDQKKGTAGKFKGEGNWSFGLRMNPWGTLLTGVNPSSGLSLADSARAEKLSMAGGACS